MIKRFGLFLSVVILCLAGCATTKLPIYIKDVHPYERIFYADYDKTLETVLSSLQDLGWEAQKHSDPSIYEVATNARSHGDEILIITKIKKIWSVTGTQDARMNIYVRSTPDSITEVEVRFLTLRSMAVKTFQDYKDEDTVNKLFKQIQKSLDS